MSMPQTEQSPEPPLWTPSRAHIDASNMQAFLNYAAEKSGKKFENYSQLHAWSVENLEDAWNAIWDFCDVIGEKGDVTLADADTMRGGQFFPNGKINYAENLLRFRNDKTALVFRTEQGTDRTLTFNQLYDTVSRLAQALKAMGVAEGDVVAGYLPNMCETIIAHLAAASLGAIWASASPDFGVQGVVDRFGQVKPKILFCVDGYFYNGKTIDCLENIKQIQPHLKGLEKTIIIPYTNDAPDISHLDAQMWEDFISRYAAKDIDFKRVDFNHPLAILFSSGTTGTPKCMVHGHGGTTLEHYKELKLHCNLNEGDVYFQFTTCGWMMWNLLISALACGTTLLLFDGSPFLKKGYGLWDYVSQYKAKIFGTSAKFVEAMGKHNIHPAEKYDLSALETLTSTGSPLVHTSFDFIHAHIKQDLEISSVSGGSDIVGCFFMANSISPVYRGELVNATLGMDMDAYTTAGQPQEVGQQGELVCKKPFPSMPVGFWGDEDGARYKKAYFEAFPGIWHHGDFIEKTANGGYIIHGRSDATLNPGGVRIGTAEIYRQVDTIPQVLDCVAVGQTWQDDERVILFVQMQEGEALTDQLVDTIKATIRTGATPRHVPAKVIEIADIPRTISGKITEIAIRDVIHGRAVKNTEALKNPESLKLYEGLAALES